jgi:hypothetical protein
VGLVIFDLQHSGKPRSLDERGAKADIDGDGRISTWEREAELVPFYVAPATRYLAGRGHHVALEAFGDYHHRHERANQLARELEGVPVAYAACHLNAGGGRSAQLFYDGRSRSGPMLAAHLASELEELPEIRNGQAFASYRDPQPGAGPGENEWRGDTSKHWTWGAWSTIAGIYSGPANIAGVCLEPWFLDQPQHKALALGEGAERVGLAVGRGLARWLER